MDEQQFRSLLARMGNRVNSANLDDLFCREIANPSLSIAQRSVLISMRGDFNYRFGRKEKTRTDWNEALLIPNIDPYYEYSLHIGLAGLANEFSDEREEMCQLYLAVKCALKDPSILVGRPANRIIKLVSASATKDNSLNLETSLEANWKHWGMSPDFSTISLSFVVEKLLELEESLNRSTE